MSDIAAPLPQPLKVNPETVEKATKALLKWLNAKTSTQKSQLLEQDDIVYLILTLKKIPKGGTSAHQIALPHPLIDPIRDSSEFCLIIDDRSKSQLTKEAACKKIQAESIPINNVLKLSKLKSDYRSFEAKRKLCNSYDMFFADKRVIPLLPQLLGKQFFKRKKIPVPVDLNHKNWKEQIEKAYGSALLYLRTGTCCVVKVAKVSMGIKEIKENVLAVISGIADIVPSKWKNIRSFHLKLLESLALPLYQAVSTSSNLKIEASAKKVNPKDEKEKKKTSKKSSKNEDDDDKNKNVQKKKKKGRIHEVRYIDSKMLEEDVGAGVEDSGNDEGNAEFGRKKRKTKSELESGETVKKKMAKVKKEALGNTEENNKDYLKQKKKKLKKEK